MADNIDLLKQGIEDTLDPPKESPKSKSPFEGAKPIQIERLDYPKSEGAKAIQIEPKEEPYPEALKPFNVGEHLSKYMTGGPVQSNVPSVIDNIIIGIGADWLFGDKGALFARKVRRQLSQTFFNDNDEVSQEAKDFIAEQPIEDQADFDWLRTAEDVTLVKDARQLDQTQRMMQANQGIFKDCIRVCASFFNPLMLGGFKLAGAGIRAITGSNLATSFMANVISKADKGSKLAGATLQFVGEGAVNAGLKGAIAGGTFALTTHEGREYIHLPIDDLGSEIVTQTLFGAALGTASHYVIPLFKKLKELRGFGLKEFKQIMLNPHAPAPRKLIYVTPEKPMQTDIENILYFRPQGPAKQHTIKWARFIPTARALESRNKTVKDIFLNFFEHQYVDAAHPEISTPVQNEMRQWQGLGIECEQRINQHMDLFERGEYGTAEDFATEFILAAHGGKVIKTLNPHVNGALTAVAERMSSLTDEAIRHGVFAYTQPAWKSFTHTSEYLTETGAFDKAKAKDILTKLNPESKAKEINEAVLAISKTLTLDAPLIKARRKVSNGKLETSGVQIPIIYNQLHGVTPIQLADIVNTHSGIKLSIRQAENMLSHALGHTAKGHRSHFPVNENAASYFPIAYDVEKIINNIPEARSVFSSAIMKTGTVKDIQHAQKIFDEFVNDLQIKNISNDPTFYWAGRASATKNRILQINPIDIIDYLDKSINSITHRYFKEMGYEAAAKRVLKVLGFDNYEQVLDNANKRYIGQKLTKQDEKDLRLLADIPYMLRGRRRPGESSGGFIDKAIDSFQALTCMRSLGNLPFTLIEDMALTAPKRGLFKHIAGVINEFGGAKDWGLSRADMMRFHIACDSVSHNQRLISSSEPLKGMLADMNSKFYKALGQAKMEDHRNASLFRVITWDIANGLLTGEFPKGMQLRLSDQSAREIAFMLKRHADMNYETFDLNLRQWSHDAQRDFISECQRILQTEAPRPAAGQAPYAATSKSVKAIAMFQSYLWALTSNVLLPLFRGGHYGPLVNMIGYGAGLSMITLVAKGILQNNPWDLRDPELYRQAFIRSPLGIFEHALNPLTSMVFKGAQGDLKMISGRDLAYDVFSSGSAKYVLDFADALKSTVKGAFGDEPLTETEIRRIRTVIPFNNLFYINPILDYFAIPAIMKATGGKTRETRSERYARKVG